MNASAGASHLNQIALSEVSAATEDQAVPHQLASGAAKPSLPFFRLFIIIAVCLSVFAVFVPLGPLMPSRLLETPWMMAMNQGLAQGLVFGKDIVFTYGPYASVYTELYHPATDKIMIFGSLFLGIGYAVLLLLLGKGEKFQWLLLYVVFLGCLVDSRDALLFSYALILDLVVYRMTLPPGNPLQLRLSKNTEYGATLLFAPLGLLPLIKGSLLPICAFTAALCFAIYWLRKKKTLAGLALAVPIFSTVLLWRISGQPIAALPGFFLSMRKIISGYTDSMSLTDDKGEWILYLFASATILLAIAWTGRRLKESTWFLCLSYTMFLFVAFKAGFVRHDLWHNTTAGTSLLATVLLLFFVLGEKTSLLPLAMGVLAWGYIGHGPRPTLAIDILRNSQNTFGQAYLGVRARLGIGAGLNQQYAEHLAGLRAEFPVPQLSGTTDIYSFNQSWLLATDNIWSPRPVVQSYSAYTPELAELNRQHLLGENAPDNILFRVEPIDGKLPSLDDGPSWPTLINRYALQRLDEQLAYFRKRAPDFGPAPEDETDFYSARHEFGEEVALPETSFPLMARMEIAPTAAGNLMSALFKLPQLHMTMRLRSGNVMSYRFIAGPAKADFLITPLVRNTEDFALLAAGGGKYLAANEVKSFTISSEDQEGNFWKKSYLLALRKVNLVNTGASEVFDKLDDSSPGSLLPLTSGPCEGMIEAVNGIPPRAGIPPVDSALSVKGWMIVSDKDKTAPDAVFVTLRNESGKFYSIKARSTHRDDIRQHFNQPAMPDPGYAALVDVSSLHGKYTLGLARLFKGNLQNCSQFQLPIEIAH
jgi:hypothetical protein